MTNTLVKIGKIVGFHGVRGELKLKPYDDNPSWLKGNQTVFYQLGRIEKTFTIQKARLQGRIVVILFKEFNNRNDVEGLLGGELFLPAEALGKLEKDEYRVSDLIGMTVQEQSSGTVKGTVKDVLSSGGAEYLEIALVNSTQTAIVPFLNHFFPRIESHRRIIHLNGLDGFLESLVQDKPNDKV